MKRNYIHKEFEYTTLYSAAKNILYVKNFFVYYTEYEVEEKDGEFIWRDDFSWLLDNGDSLGVFYKIITTLYYKTSSDSDGVSEDVPEEITIYSDTINEDTLKKFEGLLLKDLSDSKKIEGIYPVLPTISHLESLNLFFEEIKNKFCFYSFSECPDEKIQKRVEKIERLYKQLKENPYRIPDLFFGSRRIYDDEILSEN